MECYGKWVEDVITRMDLISFLFYNTVHSIYLN